jgi:hypothetical protein
MKEMKQKIPGRIRKLMSSPDALDGSSNAVQPKKQSRFGLVRPFFVAARLFFPRNTPLLEMRFSFEDTTHW